MCKVLYGFTYGIEPNCLTFKGENIMTNLQPRFDTSALTRAFIGIDRMFSDADKLFENSLQNAYPPYNILKIDDDNYCVEVAVTGFSKDEIQVDVEQQQLIIRAAKAATEEPSAEYIYKGLASRAFERRFSLAEHMQVGDASLANGLLRVYTKRILPEALRPRRIEVIA